MSQEKPPYVDQLPEGLGGGMSFDRYSEIQEAEASGEPVELTEDERAEYEDSRDSFRETLDQIQQTFTRNFTSMSGRLSSIISARESGGPTLDVDSMRQNAFESAARRVDEAQRLAQASVIDQETWDSIAEARRVEQAREDRNSENIHVTAEVMQGMLASMSEQAAQAAARDAEAKKAARKNYWLALGSLVFAGLAVVVPFVIEAIKGWD